MKKSRRGLLLIVGGIVGLLIIIAVILSLSVKSKVNTTTSVPATVSIKFLADIKSSKDSQAFAQLSTTGKTGLSAKTFTSSVAEPFRSFFDLSTCKTGATIATTTGGVKITYVCQMKKTPPQQVSINMTFNKNSQLIDTLDWKFSKN